MCGDGQWLWVDEPRVDKACTRVNDSMPQTSATLTDSIMETTITLKTYSVINVKLSSWHIHTYISGLVEAWLEHSLTRDGKTSRRKADHTHRYSHWWHILSQQWWCPQDHVDYELIKMINDFTRSKHCYYKLSRQTFVSTTQERGKLVLTQFCSWCKSVSRECI